jgi:hypothetical protein
MTRGRVIMGIFCQKDAFFKGFGSLGAGVQALVVRGAIRRMNGNLGG